MKCGEIGQNQGREAEFAAQVMRLVAAAVVLMGVVDAAVPALAQAPPVVNPVPQGSPVPRILPPAPPAVGPGTVIPPPSEPAAEVPNQPVRVSSVDVEGVTAYPQPEIAQLTAGLIGPSVPLPQIDAARQAILQRYRADGYVLTTVSAKLEANGRLRFVVTEGRIASVKLDGDIGPAGTQVLRFLNRLTEKQPIDSVTLERYLLLAQDVPGVSLRAVLEPSSDQPGALNLIAQVSRQAVSGLATIDNRAFNQTGPIELLGVLDFNSFSQYGEKTETLLLPYVPEQREFRPGIERGVHRIVRPEGAGLWRLWLDRSDREPGADRLQRRDHGVRRAGELPGDPLAAADAERLCRVRCAGFQHHHHADRHPPAIELRCAARPASRRGLRAVGCLAGRRTLRGQRAVGADLARG